MKLYKITDEQAAALLEACKAVLAWAAASPDESVAGDWSHFVEHVLPQVDAAVADADPDWV